MAANRLARLHRTIAFGLLLGVAGIYASLLPSWPVPGPSAQQTALALGLDPRPMVDHPLYRWLLRGVAWIPLGPLGFRLNLLSSACVLVGILLFHRIVFAFYSLTILSARERIRGWSAGLAAWLAAVSLPFAWAGSRATPASFHLLLLLLLVVIFISYAQTGKPRFLWILAAAYGMAAIETGVLLLLLPVAGLALLVAMFRHKQLTPGTVGLALGVGLAGCFAAIALASFDVRGMAADSDIPMNWTESARAVVAGSLGQSLQSVPRTGWLIVGLVSVVPLLGISWSAFHSPGSWLPYRKPFMLANGIFFLVAYAGLLATTPVSPWQILGEARLVLLPYLLMATTVGYAFGFAFLILHSGPRPPRPSTLHALAIGGIVFAILPLWNLTLIHPGPGKGLWVYAVEMIHSLDDRDLLVVDDPDPNLLRLAALAQNRPLTMIRVNVPSSSFEQRAIERAVDDPHLKKLARITPFAFLNDLLTRPAPELERIAFVGNAGLLSSLGYLPVPYGLVFLPGREPSDMNPDRLVQMQQAMGSRLLPTLAESPRLSAPQREALRARRWYFSRMSNDLGVFLEHLQRADLAAQAYRQAIQANPLNISARANLLVLPPEFQDLAVNAELDPLLRGGRMSIAEVVMMFGHLRSIAAAKILQDAWSAPAEPDDGPADRRREPGPDLSSLFLDLAGGHDAAALEETRRLIRDHPNSARVWWFRGVIAERSGSEADWEEAWNAMLALQQEWPLFLVIQGRRYLAGEQRREARPLLSRAAFLSPDDPDLHEIAARLERDLGFEDRALELTRRLLSLHPRHEGGLRLYEELRSGRPE